MVTEWLLGILSGLLGWVLGWIELPAPPDFLSSAGSWISTVGTYIEGTGVWIPWGLIAGVIGAVIVAFGVMVSVKGVRIVASFLTLGGGSAA